MTKKEELKNYYEALRRESNSSVGLEILAEAIGSGETKKDMTSLEIIEDPEALFKEAYAEIREKMEWVMQKKGLREEELLKLIEKTWPNKWKKLWGESYDRINTDVWGKYTEGTLTKSEFEDWKQALNEWQELWLGVLEKIEKNKEDKIDHNK